ncbi:MAG TPA: TetR/AcrR family transcriptional regulator [Bacteroidales bacterium]|nr:TetR/AcrR family transcriptional regulator [Bacteroidales bacterium]
MTEKDRQTEEKIFDAATIVFEEQGLSGARMQNIADHAGINKSLLHYYFRTKDHLFDAVFTKLAKKMFSKFTPIFEKDLTLEDKIRFFFREHITFMQHNPRLPAFIINEINHNPQRIKNLLKNIEFSDIWIKILEQHKDEIQKYNITEETIPQIMTTIASLSVFPFAAKGIIEAIFENFGIDFDKYIEERKEFAAEFIIKAITK